MTRAVKGLGSGAGIGGLVGGAGGAALGAGTRYSDARESGAGVGQSLKAGLGGLGAGAVKGMALGAAVGGLGGAAAPGLAQRLSKAPGLTGASRFGQRQVHSLTGVGDAAYVRSIGGGAAYAEKNLANAAGELRNATGPAARQRATAGMHKAQRAFDASEKSEAMGLTSIPGYAKALYKNPREALSTGIKDQWRSMGAGGKALMYGLPAAGAVGEAVKKTDESGQERGRLERAGRTFGVAASGMVAPLSIAADVVAGGAISGAMGRLGRGADHLLQRRPKAPVAVSSPEPGGGTAQAEGYQLSDRAAGTAAEGMTG